LFGLAALWPVVLTVPGGVPPYLSGVLPGLVLWGVANALIQPTLFAGADAAPRSDLALASAVLTSARQLGSAVGVAMLVGVLGAGGFSTLQFAWVIVLASALMTALAGLFARQGRDGAASTHRAPAHQPQRRYPVALCTRCTA
jgi:predicted anti-sigma-YlaC factor YlaD